uniref:Fe2OG dioxygenase domain-containing protein n=1 Tax=Oryza brachyantha TaxID=4533 RepID=J3M0P5_ORYBR
MASAIGKPLLSDLVAQSGQVPPSHIRPVGDRPDLDNVDHESGAGIPLIDLKQLDGPDRRRVVEAIGSACETDGFFMVRNHGIPEEVVEGMLRVAREFFHMSESERLKCYSDDPKKAIRLSTSFNVRTEKVSNWRDFLRLHCYPLEDFIDQWPSNPHSFRQVVGTYSTEARALALRLLEAISESLGLERGHMVQRNGRWVAVNPVPDALVINIGDQVQALSNDRYKSVLHRVIVNSESERISVPTFYCPSPDAVIAPADGLVDDGHPLAYRPFTYQAYYDEFWNMGLESASCLDRFRPEKRQDD